MNKYINTKDSPVNIFVAETKSGDDSDPVTLHNEDSWVVLRPYHESEVEGAKVEDLPKGHMLFTEFHNMTKETAMELLRMSLSTLEDGRELDVTDLFAGEDAE